VPNSQAGWVSPAHASATLGRSGVEKPALTLFSRLAATGVSTVMTSVL
jgi:hypothetical protein